MPNATAPGEALADGLGAARGDTPGILGTTKGVDWGKGVGRGGVALGDGDAVGEGGFAGAGVWLVVEGRDDVGEGVWA